MAIAILVSLLKRKDRRENKNSPKKTISRFLYWFNKKAKIGNYFRNIFQENLPVKFKTDILNASKSNRKNFTVCIKDNKRITKFKKKCNFENNKKIISKISNNSTMIITLIYRTYITSIPIEIMYRSSWVYLKNQKLKNFRICQIKCQKMSLNRFLLTIFRIRTKSRIGWI